MSESRLEHMIREGRACQFPSLSAHPLQEAAVFLVAETAERKIHVWFMKAGGRLGRPGEYGI